MGHAEPQGSRPERERHSMIKINQGRVRSMRNTSDDICRHHRVHTHLQCGRIPGTRDTKIGPRAAERGAVRSDSRIHAICDEQPTPNKEATQLQIRTHTNNHPTTKQPTEHTHRRHLPANSCSVTHANHIAQIYKKVLGIDRYQLAQATGA